MSADGPSVPGIDAGARRRLTARFGDEVAPWLDELPGVLSALARRWQLELGPPIPRGSVSVVLRCRMADGPGAVLKVSPDRARLAFEAIEPATPLVVSSTYPDLASVAELLRSLHTSGVPDPPYPTVAWRVACLFDSSMRLYDRHPELTALVPPELYERGRRLATRLAQDASPSAGKPTTWRRSRPAPSGWPTRPAPTRSGCLAGAPPLPP